ncbi:FtsK/SpoIIIE domain-containing protein [Promicromonospora sp. NPDC057138]|uniref:FtsK/SpoIIIE domain-containing protein n=1 Tax=Promicromonospora sp. NPDC057138 TaxID=3346031 RepID=UPI003645D106
MATSASVQRDITLPVIAVATTLAVGAHMTGYPATPAVWLGLLVAGWTAMPPRLSGRKNADGRLTPLGPTERKAMLSYRQVSELRWRLLLPNPDWLPGWPILSSWLTGIGAGVLATFLPLRTGIPIWCPWFNAAAAAIVVWQLAASRRRHATIDEASPGVRLNSLPKLFTTWPKALAYGVLVAVAGTTAAFHALRLPIAPSAHELYGPADAGVLTATATMMAVVLALKIPWTATALAPWITLIAAREVWATRWAALKQDPAPYLVAYETIGPLVLSTFEAPASHGAAAFYPLGPRLLPSLGANSRAAVLESPTTDSSGAPVPGSAHPTRFEILTWADDAMPDIAAPGTDPQITRLMVRAAFSAASGGGTTFHSMALTSIERLTAPDSPAIWATRWAPLGVTTLQNYRQSPARGSVGASIDVGEVVDHRMNGGVMFLGAVSDDNVRLRDDAGVTLDDLAWALGEDQWRSRWEPVLGQSVNAPTPYKGLTATARLADGQELHLQPFTTLHGESSEIYMQPKYEKAMAAAIPGSPAFCSFAYWPRPSAGHGNERHNQAFAVVWSQDPMPGLADLAPCPGDAPRWVAAGHVSRAFTDARLARPEVLKVAALTAAASRHHIWRIDIRLYGGVTLADVRGAVARLRQSLGVPWLRVATSSDGCTLYAGAAPRRARLARPQRDEATLTSLDWEQAWLDSGVTGAGALTPSLTDMSTLPHNTDVQVLNFSLPPGLSVPEVRDGTNRLKTATGNSFLDVREGPAGASSARLLVSERDPLPARAVYDYDLAADLEGLPFATAVDGTPVCFDPLVSPHLLVAGATGGGKSVTLQALLFGAIVRDWDIVIADPSKEAADFGFAKGYVRAIATDIEDALEAMKWVYAEGSRRKLLNAEHGVGSYRELPPEVRPKPLMMVIDEFTSLITQDAVPRLPKELDDPDAEVERDRIMAENAARLQIGGLAGRIARELRSAGVILVLATQKLSAKILDGIPGSTDLRSNLARILLGNASNGDRMAALRLPFEAPVLGEYVPKGRGLWESVDAPAKVVQAWYEPGTQPELARRLAAARTSSAA